VYHLNGITKPSFGRTQKEVLYLKSQVSYSEDIRTIMKRDLFGEQNDAYHKCEECGWNIGCFDE